MLYATSNYNAFRRHDVNINRSVKLIIALLLSVPALAGSAAADTLRLNPRPAGGIEVGLNNRVTVLSDRRPELLGDEPVEVRTTLGSVVTGDAAPQWSGRYVSSCGGVTAFSIAASRRAGVAEIGVYSRSGDLLGSLTYEFFPGPPVGPIEYTLGRPSQDSENGRYRAELTTGPMVDQYGNPVLDGTMLTVDLDIGWIVSPDANPEQPGHQMVVNNGQAGLTVEMPDLDMDFTLYTYADSAYKAPLGSQIINMSNYPFVPLGGGYVLFAVLFLLSVFSAIRLGSRRLAKNNPRC